MSECSSLAVVEKKPQRSGGCVGIFFQLFDWNRRLAKKKLFSKKLLPPARAKRAVKKFGGDDKLPAPKHLLIADENRGGFPNGEKSGSDNADNTTNGKRSHEMRSPTLVARLMGLESMPAVRREKTKKALFSDNRKNTANDDNRRGSENFVCEEGEFQLGKGHNKMDSRPQKLQKTGLVERRPVTRFGAEAFQFRSVLRSKKHQPKLSSPVKSPRVGRNAARLMGAATKILEPSLQASSRSKCALSYSPSFHTNSRDDFATPGKSFLTTNDTRDTNYCSITSKPLKGQPSCKSCGNWLDVVDSKSNVDEQVKGNTSSALGLGSAPALGPGRSKMSALESFKLHERDVGVSKSLGNKQSRSKPLSEMKHVFREYQEHYYSSGNQVRYQTDAALSSVRNPRTRRQGQTLPKDRGNPRSKLNTMSTRREPVAISSSGSSRDFIAVNRTSVNRSKTTMPPKVPNKSNVNTVMNASDRNDGSSSRLSSPIRRKRSMNCSVPVENASYNQSTFRTQRGVRDEVIIGRRVGSHGSSKNQNLANKEPVVGAKMDAANVGKDIGVVSFTFSSPMRHNTGALSPTITMETRSSHSEFSGNISSPKKKLTFETNKGNLPSRLASHLKGDALGALLEEKLKELNSRDRDDLETVDAVPGRSTAAILEELIVALTAERPISVDDEDCCSTVLSQDDNLSYASQDPSNDMPSHCPELIGNQKHEVGSKIPLLFAGDGEYHSPGCVLDASFSNDSCFSESIDGYTEHKVHSEYMEGSYDQPQSSEYDAELSDCATSISAVRTRIDRVIDSVDSIHSVLYSADYDIIGVVENKLNHALEIIVNADLLIGSLFDIHNDEDFPIVPLLDELENIPEAPWTTSYCKMGFTSSKHKFLERRFLLDCVVEFLDSTYRVYCKSRFKLQSSPQLQINVESLAKEVHEEIRWSANLVGKSSEEILEREMNHSFGRWNDFDLEVFEMGEEFGSDILQTLVDDMVIDLWQCS